jgi:uncharacterized surface protein with fasciclin (FAS1) repeats
MRRWYVLSLLAITGVVLTACVPPPTPTPFPTPVPVTATATLPPVTHTQPPATPTEPPTATKPAVTSTEPGNTATPGATITPGVTATTPVTSTATPVVSGTIVDVATRDGRFKTLVTAIQTAGLTGTLSGPGPYTVFAPTDTAFAKLPGGMLDALLKDPPRLANVLKYHVASGRYSAAQIVTLTQLPTLFGQPLTITVNGATVRINDALVTQTDVATSNGVIHVIDTVLFPPE